MWHGEDKTWNKCCSVTVWCHACDMPLRYFSLSQLCAINVPQSEIDLCSIHLLTLHSQSHSHSFSKFLLLSLHTWGTWEHRSEGNACLLMRFPIINSQQCLWKSSLGLCIAITKETNLFWGIFAVPTGIVISNYALLYFLEGGALVKFFLFLSQSVKSK